MKRYRHTPGMRTVVVLLLCSALSLSVVSSGGEQQGVPIRLYEGQIKSIRVDKCGLKPGSCEGAIVLAQQGGGEVVLAIKPGTWIQRGDNLVLIEQLGVGNYVKARATKLPGERDELAITLEETAGE